MHSQRRGGGGVGNTRRGTEGATKAQRREIGP